MKSEREQEILLLDFTELKLLNMYQRIRMIAWRNKYLLLMVLISLFFFWPVLEGRIPFPGDLLISEYNPWKSYSFLGYNPGSYPNKAQYFDVLRQIYPWRTLGISQLMSGSIPLWNPYNFSGAPLLANFQSAVFYPFSVIYKFIPQVWGWSILVISQPLLALAFTYLYARRIEISKFGSAFCATSFAFSSFMTVWLEYNTIGHVVLWFPLLLLCTEHLLNKKDVKWILLFVASFIFSLFAGHIQVFAYLFGFLVIYLLFRARSLRKNLTKNFIFFAVLILVSLGISGVQTVPGAELIMQSARSPHPYSLLIEKILIQPWQLIMFLIPDFFGNPVTRNYYPTDTYIGKVTSVGIVSALFIIIGILGRNKMKTFYLSICILILILVTRNPFSEIFYRISIPLISSSSPTLSVFLFCFGSSILAGIGIDTLIKGNFNLKKYFYISTSFILLFIFITLTVFILSKMNLLSLENLKISLRNTLYSFILAGLSLLFLFGAVVNKKLRYVFLVCLLVINIFDLWRLFYKFNPFSEKELVFPKTSILEYLKKENGTDRFWGYGHAAVEANFATQYNLFSPDGYDPLYPKSYGEFIESSKNGKIEKVFNVRNRSDAKIAPGFGENDLSSNSQRLRVLDLLGVKYILDRVENASSEKTFPQDRFKLVFQDNGWKVFENMKASPRMFLTSDYKFYSNTVEFEKLFFDKNFDPSKTLLFKSSLKDKVKLKYAEGSRNSVELVRYSPQKITSRIETDRDMLLFLSDTYYPGWKASLDGRTTDIYKADYAFRAIIIPAGIHNAEFIYDPQSFKIGYKISLFSFGLFTLILLLSIKRFKADI